MLFFVQEALRSLWAAAFPGEACSSLKTERWKDMGWQVRRAGRKLKDVIIYQKATFLQRRRRGGTRAVVHRNQLPVPCQLGSFNAAAAPGRTLKSLQTVNP